MKSFNGAFYATAATVIPVLFLALLLPGAPLHRFTVAVGNWKRSESERLIRRLGFEAMRHFLVGFVVGVVLLIYGTFCEICAFVALYRQHATSTESSFVISAVVALPCITAILVVGTIVVASATPEDGD